MAEPSNFAAFMNAYFETMFESNPALATAKGIHDHDRDFPDSSAIAHLKRIEQLKDQPERLERLTQNSPLEPDGIDRELIAGRTQAELLDLETVANWRRDPIDFVWLLGRTNDRRAWGILSLPYDARESGGTGRRAGFRIQWGNP